MPQIEWVLSSCRLPLSKLRAGLLNKLKRLSATVSQSIPLSGFVWGQREFLGSINDYEGAYPFNFKPRSALKTNIEYNRQAKAEVS